MSQRIVFIYFRARPGDDERVAASIDTLQATMRQRHGADLQARFGHRREEAAGQRTWLESYALAPDADVAALLALRADCATPAGLDALLEGEAHIEVFDMRGDAPCA